MKALLNPNWLTAATLTTALMLTGCERAPSEQKVIGTYRGALYGVSESIDLRRDGTFTQTLAIPPGQQLTQAGTWTIEYKVINLRQYLHFYDEEHGKLAIPPKLVSQITYVWGADMLIRDWGSAYYTLRHQ